MAYFSWGIARLAALAGSIAFLTLLVSCANVQPVRNNASPKDLDKAIISLKNMVPDNVVPDELSPADQKVKQRAIEDAWRTIEASGEKGIQRLKEEVKKTPPKKDNFFKLNVARFLWMHGWWEKPPETSGGNWDEVPDILAIWETARLSYHLHYPFYTALGAAASQDTRALPLMKALLKEHEGVVQTPHMPIAWPDTDQFIWGVYGPKGLPVLLEILQTTNNNQEKISAIHLLSDAQYMEALPLIRKMAADPDSDVRTVALLGLGHYGHPDDFTVLVAGLSADDQKHLDLHVHALDKYGDLRAVPLLIPLLSSINNRVRQVTAKSLANLLSPASLEALHSYAQNTNGGVM